MPSTVAITRVINPCTLIEIDGESVLTDPYFTNRWFIPMKEPIGLTAQELPRLAAILGGHGVLDHWNPRSLRDYPYRASTPVVVATAGMARAARRAGFDDVQLLRWGEHRRLSPALSVTSLPGERAAGTRTNCYLLRGPAVSVFIGTEARRIEPITQCAARHRVDIAILPIDGLRFLRRQLVMDARTALRATRILGAHTLVPIHYSQRPIPGLLQCPSGLADLKVLASSEPSISIRHAPTGHQLILD